MADKPDSNEPSVAGQNSPLAGTAQRPSGSHRAPDMRDTMAELTERAQLISREAGSKVAMAMKDVIAAAAGLAGFAVESARDLVQYMVRRGQMSQEEADRLIREAEEAHARRPENERSRPSASKLAADRAAAARAESIARAAAAGASAGHAARPAPPTSVTHAPAAPHNAGKATAGTAAKSTTPLKLSAAKRARTSSTAASTAKPQKKSSAKSSPRPKARPPSKGSAGKKRR